MQLLLFCSVFGFFGIFLHQCACTMLISNQIYWLLLSRQSFFHSASINNDLNKSFDCNKRFFLPSSPSSLYFFPSMLQPSNFVFFYSKINLTTFITHKAKEYFNQREMEKKKNVHTHTHTYNLSTSRTKIARHTASEHRKECGGNELKNEEKKWSKQE